MRAKTDLYLSSDLTTVSNAVAAGSAVVAVREGKDIEDSMRQYPRELVEQALAINRGETDPAPLGAESVDEEKAEEAPPEDKAQPQGDDKAIKSAPEDKDEEAPRRGRPPTRG